MKYSTIFALTLITSMGTMTAHAITPDFSPGIPRTYNECIATGASHGSCSALFAAKRKCAAENSDNEGDWRQCLASAEAAFHQSSSGAAGAGAGVEPYIGEHLPVSTNTADALYEFPANGEEKGFRQNRED